MGLHRFFFGNRTQCARLYPFAVRKLDEMRTFMQRAGVNSFSRKFESALGMVRVAKHGPEESIEIRAGERDGYYCLGDLGGATSYISASYTARGAFAPRGETTAGGFEVPNLFYVGRGYGAVPDVGGGTGVLYETRDAKSFRQVLSFAYSSDDGVVLQIAPPAVVVENDTVEQAYGMAMRFFLNGEYRAAYLYTLDGGENFSTHETQYGGGIEVGVPKVMRFAPSVLWLFVPTYKNDQNTNHELSYFVVLTDNGATAATLSLGDLGNDLNDVAEQPFNEGLQRLRDSMTGLRLSSGELLLIARSDILGIGYPRIYRMATETSTPTFVTELGNIVGDYAITGGASATEAYVEGRPTFVFSPDDTTQPKTMFVGSEDGTSWTAVLLPWPAYRTGVPKAIDRVTLVCPAYDVGTGHYVLYQTQDLGSTWEQRATIRVDAPAPSTSWPTLLRFGILSILRQNGKAANSFPGQPWIGDNRITPPWEA